MPEPFRPTDIKAMIFDVGGVLAIDAPRYFLSEVSVKEGVEIEELVGIWKKHFPILVRGQMTENEFWLAFIKDLNLEIPEEEQLSRFKSMIRLFILLDKEFLSYLRELKSEIAKERPKEPVKFAILSNNVKEWSAELEEQGDLQGVFDVIMYSCEEKIVKPDPELYSRLLKRLGAAPDEVIFIDNKAKNVQGAKAIGMYGLVFTTPDEFKAQMADLKMVKGK